MFFFMSSWLIAAFHLTFLFRYYFILADYGIPPWYHLISVPYIYLTPYGCNDAWQPRDALVA